ncbi:MAG: transglutaminase family protein [Candidatus Acinetobacter avistercoris]|uniref:transglutaminase-like domain-containing protein n=1 Tax=Acinetobacter sp. KS-LM10 TaxID=3120518 RepID=UPI001FA55867|nr:transglutaminase family protein [Candidatus Acinetobacter avistercoris]
MNTYKIECNLHYQIIQPTDFIFMIQVAYHPQQVIVTEQLDFNTVVKWHSYQDAAHQNRHLRLHAPVSDSFQLTYHATVELAPAASVARLESLQEVSIADLPHEVLPYLLSSRYCDAERIAEMANRSFGWMTPGYTRVQAIEQWIYNNIFYVSGSSNAQTTSTDVLVERAGVCRDFAHLGIALCRALGIPARMVVGYVSIKKFLPDFHAIFEVYLDGGWVLFDPTRLASVDKLVRIATGIDAGDVAFATYYGEVALLNITPLITEYTAT